MQIILGNAVMVRTCNKIPRCLFICLQYLQHLKILFYDLQRAKSKKKQIKKYLICDEYKKYSHLHPYFESIINHDCNKDFRLPEH